MPAENCDRQHRLVVLAVLSLVILAHAPGASYGQPVLSDNSTSAGDSTVGTPLLPTLPVAAPTSSPIVPTLSPTVQQQQQQTNNTVTGAVPDPNQSKTQTGLQQASAPVQGPADAGAIGTDAVVNLVSEIPGCALLAGDPYLRAGLDDSCYVQNFIARREVDLYSFTLQPIDNSTRPFRLLLVMRTVDGEAQLGLSVPEDGTTDASPEQVGTQVYGTEITTEVILEVPWNNLRQAPGRYIISISRSNRKALYTLQVQTPYSDVMLAEPDLSAIRDLYQSCCVAGQARSSLCSDFLSKAIAPNHTAEDDMCQVTPMTCNAQGRLTQLAIAQGGLVCPRGLPLSFGNLDQLRTLDLAFNNINDTTTNVGRILSSLPNLQNAFLRYTGMTGQLNCDMVTNPTLVRLSISGNDVSGRLPDCFLRDPTLQELYMSQTSLSGPLPDVVPPTSPLRLLFAINFVQTDSPGLSGPLPASLLASPSLMYMDLSNNDVSGGIGQLPPNMVIVNISANALTGSIAGPLPVSLRTFDASYNALSGPLPQGFETLTNMTLFDVHGNQLTGGLPAQLPDQLVVADFSENRFTGTLPRTLPALLYSFSASDNKLTGPLPELPNPSRLHFLQLYNNSLSGPIPASLIDSRSLLVFLDLNTNKLTGTLDGSSGAGGAGGRKLLQQQSDQVPVGPAWDMVQLTYLDLSENQISGTIPAAMGGLTDLVYMDLSENALSGSMTPYADALATNASTSPLVYLNVSNNRLSGDIPASLASAPMLDASRVRAGAARQRANPIPRTLDLSNNAFSGPFPEFLIDKSVQVEMACNSQCVVGVFLNGSDMQLACPTNMAVQANELPYLQDANFQCVNGNGQKVSLLSVASLPPETVSGAAATPASRRNGTAQSTRSGFLFPGSAASYNTAQQSGQQNQELSPGAIAGIVIGSVVGAALLLAAALFGYKKVKRHRAGWRKDDLGGNPLNDAFGVTGVPMSASAGSPFAAAQTPNGTRSVRFAENGDPQYPHSPYEQTQAAIEMQQSNDNRGGQPVV